MMKKKAIFLTFCPNHFDIYNKALTEDDKKYWESTSENSPQNSSSASPQNFHEYLTDSTKEFQMTLLNAVGMQKADPPFNQNTLKL